MTCTARVPRRASTPAVLFAPYSVASRGKYTSTIERKRAKQQEATFHYFLVPSQCQRAGNGSASGEGGVGRV